MSLILRDYQQRAAADVRAAWRTHRRVLLALPTGAGKTEVGIVLAADTMAERQRVLVVVERRALAHQWRERFRRHGHHRVGLLQGDTTEHVDATNIIATAQTTRTRGVPKNVGLVVFDESHIVHEVHGRLFAACGDARVLGLSATPLREGLGLRFDMLVIGATIKELTAGGQLVPAKVFASKQDAIAKALDQIGIRAGDYAADQLSEAMRAKALIGDIVSAWRERADGRPTIAFCVDRQHARDLAEEFQVEGVPADTEGVDADDVERFYREVKTVGQRKGWAPGAAFLKTCTRFKLNPNSALVQRTLLPRSMQCKTIGEMIVWILEARGVPYKWTVEDGRQVRTWRRADIDAAIDTLRNAGVIPSH